MALYSIIIPCYYNEENIPITSQALIANEAAFPADTQFEYILVDDGSGDKTWLAMQNFYQQYPDKVKLIKLARNFGANSASLAGMAQAQGDCITVIAADMQDPPELLVQMFEHWQKGIKLVVANRSNRADSFWGDLIANFFHYLMRKVAIPNTPKGGFDLCLFDQQVLKQLLAQDTRDVYWSYLLLWMGYTYVNIPYERRKREIGVSRWTFAKKVKSFIDNFVSFSFFPIRIISITGILLGAAAMLYALVIIVSKIMGHIDETGWSSLMVVLLLVSSFQMISLGIIGEYVWRTLQSARQRPNYIIETQTHLEKKVE